MQRQCISVLDLLVKSSAKMEQNVSSQMQEFCRGGPDKAT